MRSCLLLFIAAIFFGVAISRLPNSRKEGAASPATPSHPEDGIRPVNLSVENASWRIEGAFVVCDFSIVNRRRYPVKDVGIRVSQFGPSGSLLRSEQLIQYQVWQSGDALDFRSVRCGIAHPQCASVSVDLSWFFVDLKP